MTKRPNILFFFSDQHRGDWMPYPAEVKKAQGVEDLELKLPTISAMMAGGTAFSNACSPTPVRAPARACLASGQRYRKSLPQMRNVSAEYVPFWQFCCCMSGCVYGKMRIKG